MLLSAHICSFPTATFNFHRLATIFPISALPHSNLHLSQTGYFLPHACPFPTPTCTSHRLATIFPTSAPSPLQPAPLTYCLLSASCLPLPHSPPVPGPVTGWKLSAPNLPFLHSYLHISQTGSCLLHTCSFLTDPAPLTNLLLSTPHISLPQGLLHLSQTGSYLPPTCPFFPAS